MPGSISVIEPDFVELNIRAELSVRDFNLVFQIKKQVQERLEQFFDPLTGNFHQKGWEIGTLPNHIQIKNAISDIPGIVLVRNIYLTAYSSHASERKELDLEQMGGNRYILPINGRHELTVSVIR